MNELFLRDARKQLEDMFDEYTTEMCYVKFRQNQMYTTWENIIIPRHLITNLNMPFSAYIVCTACELINNQYWIATDLKLAVSPEINHRGKTSFIDAMFDSIVDLDMNFIPVGYYVDKDGLEISVVFINTVQDYSDGILISESSYFMTHVDVCATSDDIDYVEINSDPDLIRRCAARILDVIRVENDFDSIINIDTTDPHYSETFLVDMESFIATDKFVCTKYNNGTYGLCYRTKDLETGEFKQIYLYTEGDMPEVVLAIENVYNGLIAEGHFEIRR